MCRQSGYGRDGGKEGLWEYMKPKWQKNPKIGKLDVNLAKFGASYNAGKPAINGFQDQAGVAPKVIFRERDTQIQPLNFAYKRLLNKPYENEVTLTRQNSPSKCCQHFET